MDSIQEDDSKSLESSIITESTSPNQIPPEYKGNIDSLEASLINSSSQKDSHELGVSSSGAGFKREIKETKKKDLLSKFADNLTESITLVAMNKNESVIKEASDNEEENKGEDVLETKQIKSPSKFAYNLTSSQVFMEANKNEAAIKEASDDEEEKKVEVIKKIKKEEPADNLTESQKFVEVNKNDTVINEAREHKEEEKKVEVINEIKKEELADNLTESQKFEEVNKNDTVIKEASQQKEEDKKAQVINEIKKEDPDDNLTESQKFVEVNKKDIEVEPSKHEYVKKEEIMEEFDEFLLDRVEFYLKRRAENDDLLKKFKDIKKNAEGNHKNTVKELKDILERAKAKPCKKDDLISEKVSQLLNDLRNNNEIRGFFEALEKGDHKELKQIMRKKGVLEAEWWLNQEIEVRFGGMIQTLLEKFIQDLMFKHFEKKVEVKQFFETKCFEFKKNIIRRSNGNANNWLLVLGILSGSLGGILFLKKMTKTGILGVSLGLAMSIVYFSTRGGIENDGVEGFVEEVKERAKGVLERIIGEVEKWVEKTAKEAEEKETKENESEIKERMEKMEEKMKK